MTERELVVLGALFVSDREVINKYIAEQSMNVMAYTAHLLLSGDGPIEIMDKMDKLVKEQKQQLSELREYLQTIRNN